MWCKLLASLAFGSLYSMYMPWDDTPRDGQALQGQDPAFPAAKACEHQVAAYALQANISCTSQLAARDRELNLLRCAIAVLAIFLLMNMARELRKWRTSCQPEARAHRAKVALQMLRGWRAWDAQCRRRNARMVRATSFAHRRQQHQQVVCLAEWRCNAARSAAAARSQARCGIGESEDQDGVVSPSRAVQHQPPDPWITQYLALLREAEKRADCAEIEADRRAQEVALLTAQLHQSIRHRIDDANASTSTSPSESRDTVVDSPPPSATEASSRLLSFSARAPSFPRSLSQRVSTAVGAFLVVTRRPTSFGKVVPVSPLPESALQPLRAEICPP